MTASPPARPCGAPIARLLVGACLLAAMPLLAQNAEDLVVAGRRARAEGRLEEAAALFRRAVDGAPGQPEPLLLLAETLAWEKRFEEAERLYREALARFGPSRAARLGLGRVLLWSGDYEEAERVLAGLLDADPGDVDAREELARAWYWSGDFRRAEREFRETLRRDPMRTEARRELAEIEAASAPEWAVRASHRSDDQPYRLERAEAELSLFSDPLTRWRLTAGAYRTADPRGEVPYLGVGSEIALPAARLTIAPQLRLLSFADGNEVVLGGLRVSRKLARSSAVSAAATRNELLLNREGADDHAWVTDLVLEYELASASGAMARIRTGASRYFDGNQGAFADAYVLVPLHRGTRMVVSLGGAAAYRDTDEGRFRIERAIGIAEDAGRWSYRWEGVYDPYWTPHDLEELRAIANVRSAPESRITWNVQVSGGTARDRAAGFGPRRGTTPSPPFSFQVEFDRTYRPWTASAHVEVPIGEARRVRFDYEHMSSVYYEADEFRAALVGRF